MKQEDLIGSLKGFPIEVVQKMVENQVGQGNEADITVFQQDCVSEQHEGGFDWMLTEEGEDFWYDVIVDKNFEIFFEKYPKIGSWRKPKPVVKPEKWYQKFKRYHSLNLLNIIIILAYGRLFVGYLFFNEEPSKLFTLFCLVIIVFFSVKENNRSKELWKRLHDDKKS